MFDLKIKKGSNTWNKRLTFDKFVTVDNRTIIIPAKYNAATKIKCATFVKITEVNYQKLIDFHACLLQEQNNSCHKRRHIIKQTIIQQPDDRL